MKRIIFSMIFICGITNISAQDINVDSVINYAKAQLKPEKSKSDYKTAADLLEKVVQIQPKNAEAYYLLGYSYEAINASCPDYDRTIICSTTLALALKASAAIEKSIELEPKYTGEIIYLDPYTKLSSIWGWYAFLQYYKGNIDSAKWALLEGKKRGGFSNYSLSYYRKVLEKCSNNAILFTYGDLSFFSILYLQLVNNIRTDVTHIELSQITATWYIQFLQSKKKVPFSISPKQCQELSKNGYRKWKPEQLTIKSSRGKFTWKPTTEFENYLLWQEEIMLDLIKTNKFKKDIFFTAGVEPSYYLGLDDFFISNFISDRVNYDNQDDLTINQMIELIEFIYNDIYQFNSAVTDDFICIVLNRMNILSEVYKYIKQNKLEDAYLLYDRLTLLDDIEKNPYPVQYSNQEKFHRKISDMITESRQEDKR